MGGECEVPKAQHSQQVHHTAPVHHRHMAQQGMPDYQREQPEQQVAVGPAAAGRRDDGLRRLFLDAGRVLMLWGWGALAAAVSAAGENRRPDLSSAVHAFLALALWLLGVSLVALGPVARRFPPAAQFGTAVANAVIDYFFLN